MPLGDFLKKTVQDLLATPGGGGSPEQSDQQAAYDESDPFAAQPGGTESAEREEVLDSFRGRGGTGQFLDLSGDFSGRWHSDGPHELSDPASADTCGFVIFDPASGVWADLWLTSDGSLIMESDGIGGQLSGRASPGTYEFWPGRGFRLNAATVATNYPRPMRVTLSGTLTYNEPAG